MIDEKIIALAISKNGCQVEISINLLILLILTSLFVGLYAAMKYLYKKNRLKSPVLDQIVPVEMKFEVGGLSTTYKIVRNYANIEIAHKIYIELITRKAAIPLDENNDVIIEIYNSWYNLFQITRNELKNITGDLLHHNEKSSDLIRLATDILNKGLRPHLTKYQAQFRKWHEERMEIEKTKSIAEKKSPQDIDKEYPKYNELIGSIKHLNDILFEYSQQLKKIIGAE